jgi:hypothetical protein
MATVHMKQLGYLRKLLQHNCRCGQSSQNCPCIQSRATRALETEIHENANLSWYNHMITVLVHHGLLTDMDTIRTTPKATWKTMVKKAVSITTTRQYTQEAAKSIKMIRGINMAKSSPSLEKYMVELKRKHATAIFRLRTRTTRAAADMTSYTNTPICGRCNDGYESDTHLFTNCIGTQQQRNKWGVTDLTMLYESNTSMQVLKSYAAFAIDIAIVPEW